MIFDLSHLGGLVCLWPILTSARLARLVLLVGRPPPLHGLGVTSLVHMFEARMALALAYSSLDDFVFE